MTTTELNSSSAAISVDEEAIIELTPRQLLFRRAKSHKGLIIGFTIIAFLMLVGLFAPVISPYDPFEQDLPKRLLPPFWSKGGTVEHFFGTDHLGRDYLSRLIHGTRISLMIGYGAATVFFIGPSVYVVIGVIGVLHWPYYLVVTRAAAMQIRELDYIDAARSLGIGKLRIISGEILPNLMNHMIVIFTLEVGPAILSESALSFLGVGIQPPTPSWGLMIAEGKAAMFFQPWLIIIPGMALFILVLATNLMGDGLRDVTSPENRN